MKQSAGSDSLERRAKINALIGAGILNSDGSLKDLTDAAESLAKTAKDNKDVDPPSPEETPKKADEPITEKEVLVQVPDIDVDGFKSKIKFYLMTSKFI